MHVSLSVFKYAYKNVPGIRLQKFDPGWLTPSQAELSVFLPHPYYFPAGCDACRDLPSTHTPTLARSSQCEDGEESAVLAEPTGV